MWSILGSACPFNPSGEAMSKVRLNAIRLRAGEIASKIPNLDRERATQALIDAHLAVGIEIDYSDSPGDAGDLDFAKGEFNPTKTQRLR